MHASSIYLFHSLYYQSKQYAVSLGTSTTLTKRFNSQWTAKMKMVLSWETQTARWTQQCLGSLQTQVDSWPSIPATHQQQSKGLLLRAERFFSTPYLLKNEMERIYSEPLNKSYPKKFIDRVKLDVISLHSLRTQNLKSDQINAQSGRYPSGIRLYKQSGEVANPRQWLNSAR